MANRTPPVATTGTRNASARQTSIVVVVFLLALQMALHLDVDCCAPEDADQPVEQPADAEAIGLQQRPPGQRDEPADVAVEILERERALAFRRAQLHRGDQPAEVAVALLGRDKDGT